MMAIAYCKCTLNVLATFTIDEEESRALDALAGYGDDAFIKAFYENLGKAYMEKHEAGLRRFLKTIRDVTNPALAAVDDARLLLKKDAKKK
jgi:hypothetical protein